MYMYMHMHMHMHINMNIPLQVHKQIDLIDHKIFIALSVNLELYLSQRRNNNN